MNFVYLITSKHFYICICFLNSEFQQLSALHKLLKTDGLKAETFQPPDSHCCVMTLERSKMTSLLGVIKCPLSNNYR